MLIARLNLMEVKKDIIKKFPAPWRGLFQAAVKHPDQQLAQMEAWYQQETSSRYGSCLSWNDLISSLLIENPAVVDCALVFKTRLSQLPPCLQQAVLSFLLHHRHVIPISTLKTFVKGINSSMSPDSWVGILYRMINSYVQGCSVGETTADCSHEFSTENKELVESLQQKLRAQKKSISPWTVTSELLKDKKTVVEFSSADDVRVMSPSMSPDIVMMDDDYEPPVKSQRLDQESFMLTQLDQSQLLAVEEEESLEIPSEDLEKMETLKDKWENGEDGEAPVEMEMFLTSNSNMVERLCQEIDVADISEVALTTACKHLIMKENLISHGNCRVLLTALFTKKLKHLSQIASRSLYGVVSMVAEKFAKPLIDGVFIPCTSSDDFSTFQADLVIKVCKDVFQNTDRTYFLEGMLKVDVKMDDSLISVLHNLFENKLNLDNTLLTSLLELLKGHGYTMEKNLKFGKLILEIVNKYGTQMTTEQKELLSQILMSHKSFLKKSIQTAMSKASS